MAKLDRRVRERALGSALPQRREPRGARPEMAAPEIVACGAAGRRVLPARSPEGAA